MENVTLDEIAVEIPWSSCSNPLEGLRDGIQNTISQLDSEYPEWRKLGGSYWVPIDGESRDNSEIMFCFRRYKSHDEIEEDEALEIYRQQMRVDNLKGLIREFPEAAKKILSEMSNE